MISFQPTVDEIAFRNLARNFAKEKLRPLARDFEETRQVSDEISREINELGFSALELPADWDGLELPLISQVQIVEALSAGDLGGVQGFRGPGEAASLFRLVPAHPLFNKIKKTTRDKTWPAVAFLNGNKPNHSSSLRLELQSSGGGYLLNGTSRPLRMAKYAGYLLVGLKDTTGEQLLIWLEDHGQWRLLEGDYRLGLLASGFSKIQFHDTVITDEQVLAKGHEAKVLLSQMLTRTRVLEAAKEVGAMEAALDHAAVYTAQRKAFGQEIAKFQGVSFTLADMSIKTQAARHLVWQSALKVDDRDPEGEAASQSALQFAHQSLRFVTDCAVQLLGGHGYVQDFPVEKWMRDAQAQIIFTEGESELLLDHGEWLIVGEERGGLHDFIQNVAASNPG
ncbi:acyl-CoA dehydrogenase family protein [Fictibacillus sp. NRS-1165]|uniref:acyl-CoA dehydrogenase family protein n=1 Tax=Fictibacillus sp. NRS-1165 TaxID=3144463 RepID=UPI003D1D14BB